MPGRSVQLHLPWESLVMNGVWVVDCPLSKSEAPRDVGGLAFCDYRFAHPCTFGEQTAGSSGCSFQCGERIGYRRRGFPFDSPLFLTRGVAAKMLPLQMCGLKWGPRYSVAFFVWFLFVVVVSLLGRADAMRRGTSRQSYDWNGKGCLGVVWCRSSSASLVAHLCFAG
ncbi:hypothetical protein DQ04_00981070 [Trypanosoma grayi]|uniref:hypothetical protein n=1 Tax=Trypanosoma grayi TaxID=71804 RepID=UPI0004F42D38|nr:hypothetical protein DQ04_00981070 [Trypanosoma grayi]KEG13477.1 hypothetical protein DQ04_00981070 [Trypanosoma grayi]